MTVAVTVEIPDYVKNVPSTSAVHNAPAPDYQWANLSAEQLNALRTRLIQSMVQVVVQAVTGLFIPGGNNAATQQLEEWATDILDKLTNIENFLNFDLLGDGNLEDIAERFIQQNLQPFARLIFSYIRPEWIPQIPLSNIGTAVENLLTSGSFQTADTLRGDGIFTWISDGYSQPGAIRVIGDGSLKEIYSGYGRNGEDAIPVSEGQQLDLSCRVRYSGLPAAGQPVVMGLATYYNDVEMSKPVIQAVGGVSSSGWVQLSGTYTVPAGVNFVRMRLALTAVATTGTVDFDSADLHKVGLLQPTFIDGLSNLFTNFTSAVDLIFNRLTGQSGIVGVSLDTLSTALLSFWNLVDNKLDPDSAIDPTQIFGLPNLFATVDLVTNVIDKIAPPSGASMYRTATSTVARASGTNVLPNNFFATNDYASDDITLNLTDGSFTVTEATNYIAEVRIEFPTPSVVSGSNYIALAIFVNGGLYKLGNTVTGTGEPQAIWSSFVVSLNANDKVQAGYVANISAAGTFTGDATGARTYFTITRASGVSTP